MAALRGRRKQRAATFVYIDPGPAERLRDLLCSLGDRACLSGRSTPSRDPGGTGGGGARAPTERSALGDADRADADALCCCCLT